MQERAPRITQGFIELLAIHLYVTTKRHECKPIFGATPLFTPQGGPKPMEKRSTRTPDFLATMKWPNSCTTIRAPRTTAKCTTVLKKAAMASCKTHPPPTKTPSLLASSPYLGPVKSVGVNISVSEGRTNSN